MLLNILTYVARGVCAGVVLGAIVLALLWVYDMVVGNR